MKPTNVLNVQRTGDFGGEKIAMGIDAASLAHVMSVLTDLYSNTVLACVREYSTNARDSHIDAGVDRPIEVTLPAPMSPFFKVKDFGLGLNLDDIYKVYSQYGASTKRDRDTVNGMLGLGCKSALTYASQFTIVSVKDGVKITVVVSRSEDGTAMMEVVDTVTTSEGNGVEIKIPVKQGDSGAFHKEASEFYQWWPEGSVLVNGEAPARTVPKMVTAEMGTVPGTGSDLIVFGGVAYPVKDKGLFAADRPYNAPYRVVAFLDPTLGDDHKIVFTPNREALTYTGVTLPTLDRLRKEFSDKIIESIQNDVDSFTHGSDAYQAFLKYRSQYGSELVKGVTYMGKAFPAQFSMTLINWNSNYGRSRIEYYDWTAKVERNVNHEALSKGLIMTGYDGVQITSKHKEKIRTYKDAHNISAQYHVFTDKNPAPEWLTSPRVVTWQEIKAIRLPSDGAGPRGPRNPAFPVYNPATGYSTQSIPLDKTKTLLYVSPKRNISARTIMGLYKAFPNVQIFCLGENRWDKFKRENPGSENLQTWVTNQVKAARDALTADDILILNMTRYRYNKFADFDLSKIDDPALSKAMGILAGKVTSPEVIRYRVIVDVAQTLGHYERDLPSSTDTTLDNYPLLTDNGGSKARQHMYFYVNAVYKARTNGESI